MTTLFTIEKKNLFARRLTENCGNGGVKNKTLKNASILTGKICLRNI